MLECLQDLSTVLADRTYGRAIGTSFCHNCLLRIAAIEKIN